MKVTIRAAILMCVACVFFAGVWGTQAAHRARLGDGMTCGCYSFPTMASSGDILRMGADDDWLATSGYVVGTATSSWDWTGVKTLTNMGGWTTIDVSTNENGEAVVPGDGVKAVNLISIIQDDSADSILVARATNAVRTTFFTRVKVAGISEEANGAVPISGQTLNYYASTVLTNATLIGLKIIGWWY